MTAAPPSDAASPSSAPRSGIQELLDARAAAILDRDRAAFTATLYRPRSAFGREQADLFDASGSVPFASYTLTADWERYGDLARPSDIARYPEADAVAIPVTDEHYRIEGFDKSPAAEDAYFTFVRVGAGWKIASDTDVADIGFDTVRHLWDFGPVVAERSTHFLLLRHLCSTDQGSHVCATLPTVFPDLAEQAIARVAKYWQVKWRHKVVILVPNGKKELARMLQATFDLSNFVAFAYSTEEGAAGGLGFTGPRIVLNWRTLTGRSTAELESLLSHELLHIATRASSGPFLPTFVEEGLAEMVGNDADPATLAYLRSIAATTGVTPKLPHDWEFTTGSGSAIYLNYQKAQSAIMYLAQTYGLEKLLSFYRFLGRQRVTTGTSRYQLDRAFKRVIHTSYKRFERAWASTI